MESLKFRQKNHPISTGCIKDIGGKAIFIAQNKTEVSGGRDGDSQSAGGRTCSAFFRICHEEGESDSGGDTGSVESSYSVIMWMEF